MMTSVTKGGTGNCPKYLRLLKPTDMTIHQNALEEHFLMIRTILMQYLLISSSGCTIAKIASVGHFMSSDISENNPISEIIESLKKLLKYCV
jgi:hypothetical protein